MDADERSPLNGGDHKRSRSCLRSVLTRRVVTAVILNLVLSLLVIVGCAIAFRYKYAACYSILSSGPTIDAHTRSGAYSILYTTFALTCSEKETTTEAILNDVTASVDLYQSPCEAIEKMLINDSYSWNNTRIGSEPVPIFSEDFSSHQNYFISGSICVDMINITSTGSSPNITEVCLYTDIDDFCNFVAGGANWKNHAKCRAVQVKTRFSDNSSITFNLSEPTFAFVGIAATSNISLNIGKLTVTTNGVGLSGPGRNWTQKCQLNSKHNTCKFSLINNSREEICLIAHEKEHSDGYYSYSNLKIRLWPQINFRFWICIAVLSLLILIMLICIVTVLVVRARRKQRLKKLKFETAVPETSGDQSNMSLNMSHSVNSDHIPSDSPTRNSEQDSRSSENHSRNLFDSPDSEENPDSSREFVVPKLTKINNVIQ